MKHLFDQNLSPQLTQKLADIFPNSIHIRNIGMRDATDTEIWNYAKQNDFRLCQRIRTFNSAACFTGIRQNSSGCALEIVRLKQSKNYCENIRFRFTLLI